MPRKSELKEHIINELKSSDIPVSGADLALKFKVSGTAIWKHIQNLRADGYKIDGSTRIGYTLKKETKLLLPEEIRYGLSTKWLGKKIFYLDKVVSTNAIAKTLIRQQKADHGSLVIAEEQTGGRGRMRREWVSPRNGLWMTLILQPEIKLERLPLITLMTAVSVHQAITTVTGLRITIKWPNDLLIKGKKICGILTEMEGEQDAVHWLYIGIGINANCPLSSYPPAVREKITTLKQAAGASIDRKSLIKEVLKQIELNYEKLSAGKYSDQIKYWKENCETLGKNITLKDMDRTIKGKAIDIDPQGGLIIEEKGKRIVVRSGDIAS